MAQGETPQEALENLDEVRIDYFEHLLEFKLPIPVPNTITTRGIVGESVREVVVKKVTFPGYEDFSEEAIQSDRRRIFLASSSS